jgi:two-component system response regulator MprA
MRQQNKKLIFVIEDSEDIQGLVKLLFEGEGYQVETGMDGEEAIRKLRALQELPCFILLDLMMPGMDGYQFRKVQETNADLAAIPVVIMTADSNAETKAISLGAKGYIKKPVNIKDLLNLAKQFSG